MRYTQSYLAFVLLAFILTASIEAAVLPADQRRAIVNQEAQTNVRWQHARAIMTALFERGAIPGGAQPRPTGPADGGPPPPTGALGGGPRPGPTGQALAERGALTGGAQPAPTGRALTERDALTGGAQRAPTGRALAERGALSGDALPGPTWSALVKRGAVTPGAGFNKPNERALAPRATPTPTHV